MNSENKLFGEENELNLHQFQVGRINRLQYLSQANLMNHLTVPK